jgi:hypothetical protein
VLELAACTSGAPKADVTCEPHGTRLHIAVVATHTFTTECLAAPSEQPFTIDFNNQDTSTHGNHNIHIYDSPEDFIGETVIHGRSITYSVRAMPAGTYLFRCDEHPTLMDGFFIVR